MSQPHFIVSHYLFAEHPTFAQAEAERVRLSELFPGKKFKIYGITEEYQNIEMRDPKRKYKRKLFEKTLKPAPAREPNENRPKPTLRLRAEA
jgi:hypothetical protein